MLISGFVLVGTRESLRAFAHLQARAGDHNKTSGLRERQNLSAAFNPTGGNAGNDGIVGHVVNHHGSRPHDGVTTDNHTMLNDRPGTDQRTAPHCRTAAKYRAGGQMHMIFHDTMMLDDGSRINKHALAELGLSVDDGPREQLNARTEFRARRTNGTWMSHVERIQTGGPRVCEESAAGRRVGAGSDSQQKMRNAEAGHFRQHIVAPHDANASLNDSMKLGITVEADGRYRAIGGQQCLKQNHGVPADADQHAGRVHALVH